MILMWQALCSSISTLLQVLPAKGQDHYRITKKHIMLKRPKVDHTLEKKKKIHTSVSQAHLKCILYSVLKKLVNKQEQRKTTEVLHLQQICLR